MAKQQVAKIEAEPEAATEAREVRPLKPDALTWNSEGFVFREGVVRLPADVIMQDLSVPGLWRVVQGNVQKSLRKLDRLVCIRAGDAAAGARGASRAAHGRDEGARARIGA